MTAMKRPNLFIMGAMKSGTSSLHYYLNTHPEIFMCEPKEPSYFVHPDELNWPTMRAHQFWEYPDRYFALFQEAGTAKIIGESSTLYTKFPHITQIPERIYQFNPEARFIYVMRDPITRTISHYWHETRQGNEQQDILTALRENPLYRDVSNYGMQLRLFFEQFGADQVFTTTLEEMVTDPRKVVQTIFNWLGVDATFEPPNIDQKMHVTPQKFYPKNRLFRWRYTWPWSAIADLLPKGLRQQGLKSFVPEVEPILDPEQKAQVIDYLRPIQQAQVQELSQLLHREFPQWKTLFDSPPSDENNA